MRADKVSKPFNQVYRHYHIVHGTQVALGIPAFHFSLIIHLFTIPKHTAAGHLNCGDTEPSRSSGGIIPSLIYDVLALQC